MKKLRLGTKSLVVVGIVLLAGYILYRNLLSDQNQTEWVADVVNRTSPAVRAAFLVYAADDRLLFTGDQCSDEDLAPSFGLHVYPSYADVLPVSRRREGYGYHDFQFADHQLPLVSYFKDIPLPDHVKCAAVVRLPEYEIARIRTGQYVPGKWLWMGNVRFDLDAERIVDVIVRNRPAIRARFDVYHDGGRLLYAGEKCGEEDVSPPFALHVYPVDTDVLPAPRREEGFDYLDFEFTQRQLPLDLYFTDVPLPPRVGCLAMVELPGYEVARIRTGQHLPGEWIWWEEFEIGGEAS